jgi:hypothetical protein
MKPISTVVCSAAEQIGGPKSSRNSAFLIKLFSLSFLSMRRSAVGASLCVCVCESLCVCRSAVLGVRAIGFVYIRLGTYYVKITGGFVNIK